MATTKKLARKYADTIRSHFVREYDGVVDIPKEVDDAINSLVSMLDNYYDHYSETWLVKPHEHPEECPTYYNGCNCTVSVLEGLSEQVRNCTCVNRSKSSEEDGTAP